jgi:uncharacterized protein YbgA (DUF1722 family)
MKNLSQNSLEELLALIEQVNKRINDYSHVSGYLPESLTKELKTFYKKLCKEYDKRII